jgi:Domain of unknown function (DUF4160)
MFFHDHLPPHFHVQFAEYEAQISIETGELVAGNLPRRELRLVQAWTEIHRKELFENYNQSQTQGGIISKIEPLK